MNGSDPLRYGREYFAPRRRNLYGKLFGSKGYVPAKLRRELSKNAAILDVGCGTGQFLEDISDFPNRRGCDVSEEALRLTAQRNPGIALARMEPNGALPFAEVQFDCVTLFDVIEHVTEDRTLLQKISARLKAGGILVLSTPNTRSVGRRIKGRRWFAYRDETHCNVQELPYFEELLDSCGFAVKDVRYDGLWDAPYFLPTPWPERLLFQLPSVLLFRFAAIRHPGFGENVWIWARKK
jgi:SAM-dependent methyltransferase